MNESPASAAASPSRAPRLGRPRAARRATQGPSPFVKWAGGKGRLLAQLTPLLPPGVDRMRHVEPFVGGGALFFARRPERALLCDVNASLIGTYVAVRDAPHAVLAALERLADAHDEATYYAVRDRYNDRAQAPAYDGSPSPAAMFIYLNKTCFNGLHRVNSRGEFNVPVGRYDNPRIVDTDGLLAASHALAGADLEHCSFDAMVERARPGDFVYFDPPYAPVSETASFTSYASGGFGFDAQVLLRDVFAELDRRRCKLMLSNSDVPAIRALYEGFRIHEVQAPRAINANVRRRGPVRELVICNY